MYAKRTIAPHIAEAWKHYPVISIHGPRQSGKTTLVQTLFPDVTYVNLENPDTRRFAIDDPRGFFDTYAKSALIIDEVQRVPDLFSYIQTISDDRKKPGQFILTGSQNVLLHEGISQSLAGRVALFTLLPFGYDELHSFTKNPLQLNDYLYQGMYPRIYEQHLKPNQWYENYIETYLEKDVRSLKNITDLHTFYKFLRLCAGRTGQILNLSTLANDCDITHNTAKEWISVLEASYIIFFLEPYYNNFNKRLVKSPKLYFYDTGLASSLLGIKSEEQIATYYASGALFETYVISEIRKQQFHTAERPTMFFWKDKTGKEIDCILEENNTLKAIEIKKNKTVQADFFSNFSYWNKLIQNQLSQSYVIYGGDENQTRTEADVVSWRNIQQALS